MNKLFAFFLMLVFPALALADSSSLSFTPPATDYSMVFLGNLFGVVEGILHGTGSQILGAMFSVFNSAVLALGGIVIMYTLMVSTMNTANEGQVLGQKWNSVWIPVRSTLGLALLIPKASGYCLMQVFIMWIVVQGVGAADKIWDAALGYMNKGGVIVRAEIQNPLSANNAPVQIANGAAVILSGQVCMLGLERSLRAQRQQYMEMKAQNTGPCYGSPTGPLKTFCDTAVPDFLSSVNAVAVQTDAMNDAQSQALISPGTPANTPQVFSVTMPNFDQTSPYSFLNGLCGNLQWNAFDQASLNAMMQVSGSSNVDTLSLSRAIGIQAMYSTLQSNTQTIINNDPYFQQNSERQTNNSYSEVSNNQFGVPFTQSNNLCTNNSTQTCVLWNKAPGSENTVIFNGAELMGAVSDYNAVLSPAMNLLNESAHMSQAQNERLFINLAEEQGWIMAGSYFFDLVRLNGSADATTQLFDQNSGLNNSVFDPMAVLSAFGPNNTCTNDMCYWFDKNSAAANNIVALISGYGNGGSTKALSLPDFNQSALTSIQTVSDIQSSTVFGFITNSMTMQTPGQPGLVTTFALPQNINVNISTTQYRMQRQHFDCGNVPWINCLGRTIANATYNWVFLTIYNALLDTFGNMIQSLLVGFMLIPMAGMMEIFREGLAILNIPGINPIVALGNMGVVYINFAADLWIQLMMMAITASLLPVIGIFVFALLGMGLPILMAWTGVMVAVGFTTAYYVPILPYMVFTLGSIAWLMAVLEAMVAGPIVALGVTHPEGHDAFGKGESAVMILLNVFLRPSMMIIGYIAGIALSYIGVWILNAGFGHAISFMVPPDSTAAGGSSATMGTSSIDYSINQEGRASSNPTSSSYSVAYSSWAAIYGYFFAVLIYTTTYLAIVQKSFMLISELPDKILRWISGQQESYGSDAAKWTDELKGQIKEGGKASQDAQSQVDKQAAGVAQKAVGAVKDLAKDALSGGGSASASGD